MKLFGMMRLALIGRSLLFFALMAVAVQLAGCGTVGDQGVATPADLQATATAATAVPRIQGGEKIRITVYNEPTLSGDYDIDPNGVVSLPLAGSVQAVGLTQPQLEQELAKKFKSEYLKNLYCGPVLRQPAELIQAANDRSVVTV